MLPVLWGYNRRIFWWSVVLLSIGLSIGLLAHTSVRSADSYVLTSGFRKLYWSHLLTMLPQSPWLGHGYGSFEYTFLHDFYALEHITPGMRLMEENLDHPHNEVLFWLHEGGIVAVIGLMVFATGYICALFKCAGWAKRISLLALVLPLLFHSMVEYPFYHSVAHFFLFVLFLWLADAESGLQKVYVCQYWFLARVVAVIIPLIVVPFMLTGLQAAYVLTKYDRAKDKNSQVLEQIINPLPWMMMYEFQMRSVQLTFSAAMHDKAGLESYVDWAKQFLHNTPRAVVYGRLVYALQQLNDKEQAQFWLDEGKRVFPRADFLQKISLSSKPAVSGAK
jgi:O-antigen polymerase